MDDDNVAVRKRERSTRYPGSPLAECIEFARFIETKGLDGLPATEVALAMGYKSVKTNTFSAPLSAARQFGLLTLKDDAYSLTQLARSILHPVDPAELPRLHRKALLEPPLYAELAQRLADKRVPEAAILANVLYHQHHIIATAKDAAAETFLQSARFAGVLGDEGIFRPQGEPLAPPLPDAPKAADPVARRESSRDVRLDLRLWGDDQGKTIRLRAPETISAESFERFLQAFHLLVKVEGRQGVTKP